MNVLMVTNTFAPHVGGVAHSVANFAEEYRRRGHRVLVVAPMFNGAARQEADVIRIGALQNFNGTDFSVVFPPRMVLARTVDAFRPDVIHSHHPFLLGATAARLARSRRLPLVFTHHTLYERYTHYLPGDSAVLRRFAVRLSTRYANRSTGVFAPSRSVVEILRKRQVTAPILVVPTGVRIADFLRGNGIGVRSALGIPDDAVVVGHVGRLAEEKNLGFLTRATAAFLSSVPRAYSLIVGEGPSRDAMRTAFRIARVDDRVRFAGTLRSSHLVDAYHAMDVFAFASVSETQGLVLAEAMASGVPVVALDAPGSREIVQDGVNGRLLRTAGEAAFAHALAWVATQSARKAESLRAAARATANSFSLELMADRALTAYQGLVAATSRPANPFVEEMPLGNFSDSLLY
jgi:glycosyltransferase involved in cell wall biosynthesis